MKETSTWAAIEASHIPYVDVDGTCLKGEMKVVPADLVLALGNPTSSDGYKVSGEYIFKHRSGSVMCLYEWKWTTLYDDDNPYTPEQFWKLTEPMNFHLGAKSADYINDFKAWLLIFIRNRKQDVNGVGYRG